MSSIPIDAFFREMVFHLHNHTMEPFITPIRMINIPQIDAYFEDIEHGFFHALCACYISYILEDKNINVSIICSLLLHDFLKCNGYSQEEHDRKLIEYFPDLLEETYTHSNPPDETKLLILCDRLELQRYPDYMSWVDTRFHDLLNGLPPIQAYLVHMFYDTIRPVLESAYTSNFETTIPIEGILADHMGKNAIHALKRCTELFRDLLIEMAT